MKKSLILVLLLIVSSLLIAESEKIVYIDTERILEESKDTQEAQRLFAIEQENWQAQLNEMEAELERLNTEYESKKMILTETGKAEAEEKINQLLEQRQAFIQEIYGENGIAIQKNAELLEPILTKLKNVVEKVAIENNYSIVLDAASGAIRYAKQNLDITDEIIEEMDKAVE